MLKILFFAFVIGLGLRGVRALFSPAGRGGAGSAGARGSQSAPGSGHGPAVKDVPEADYRWHQQNDPPGSAG